MDDEFNIGETVICTEYMGYKIGKLTYRLGPSSFRIKFQGCAIEFITANLIADMICNKLW